MDWTALSGFAVLAGLAAPVFTLCGLRREKLAIEAWETRLWERTPAASAETEPFRLTRVDELPAPAARYLRWSIEEGAPLANAVRLRMNGRIRLGRGKKWMPLVSEEVLDVQNGFVWKARTGSIPPIAGYDRFVDASGEMCWRLAGVVPVLRAKGEDITRSALERFLAEHLLVPSSLLPRPGVEWRAVDPNTADLSVGLNGASRTMRLTVDPDGMPRKLFFERWGNFETERGQWRPIPYAIRFEGVYRTGGYTLPHEIRASWWADTDRELAVVELEIEAAEFR